MLHSNYFYCYIAHTYIICNAICTGVQNVYLRLKALAISDCFCLLFTVIDDKNNVGLVYYNCIPVIQMDRDVFGIVPLNTIHAYHL